MAANPKKWVDALVMFAGLIAALGLAEGTLRLLIPAPGGEPALVQISEPSEWGPWNGYRLAPGQKAFHNGVAVEVNRWGCREQDFAEFPAKGTKRILITGDSFVYGDGVPQAEILSAALRLACGTAVEIISCGQWGYNSVDSYQLYQTHLKRFHPDQVLQVHVLNDTDCRQFCPAGPAKGPLPFWSVPGSTRSSLRLVSLLHSMGDGVLNGKTHVAALHASYGPESPGWELSRMALERYAQTVTADGAQFRLAIFPMMLDFVRYPYDGVHESIVSFCRDSSVECLDLLPAFRSAGVQGSSLKAHLLDSHPNGRAMKIAAESLAAFVGCRK